MSRKCYFLAPTRETPPGSRIVLGNIIESISEPEDVINEGELPELAPGEIFETTKEHWKNERTESRGKKGSVWAGFLQVLGVGGQISLNRTDSRTDTYEVDKLTTTSFVPTTRYLEKSLANPAVQNWMTWNRGASLYMVTGIKVASGAKVLTKVAKERGFCFQLGVDATPLGVPLSAGPNVEISHSSVEEDSSDAVSDFVFAFRVRKIIYKAKTPLTSKNYVKGAMYGLEDPPHDDGEKPFAFEVNGLAGQDPTKDDLDFEFDTLDAYDEDGSIIDCVVPEGFYTG